VGGVEREVRAGEEKVSTSFRGRVKGTCPLRALAAARSEARHGGEVRSTSLGASPSHLVSLPRAWMASRKWRGRVGRAAASQMTAAWGYLGGLGAHSAARNEELEWTRPSPPLPSLAVGAHWTNQSFHLHTWKLTARCYY
jgi:hypothetical protein